jgi:hypothetical protein
MLSSQKRGPKGSDTPFTLSYDDRDRPVGKRVAPGALGNVVGVIPVAGRTPADASEHRDVDPAAVRNGVTGDRDAGLQEQVSAHDDDASLHLARERHAGRADDDDRFRDHRIPWKLQQRVPPDDQAVRARERIAQFPPDGPRGTLGNGDGLGASGRRHETDRHQQKAEPCCVA